MSSKVDSVVLYRIRKILSELSSKEGRGTELISLYIPSKKQIHEVSTALKDEYGSASNIKSDITRNHVQDALVKTMQRLKLFRRTPEAGVAIFCGALPTNGPGSEVVRLHEVIPPKPIQTYLYRCDDHFHLDIIRDMLRDEKIVGVLSLDSTEAGLGLITGSNIEIAESITSGVGGKHRAGGQSARRFQRLREAGITEFFNRVSNHASKIFLDQNTVNALIISGPGPTKDNFIKGEYLDYRLQKGVIAVLDTSYSGREGIRETLGKSQDVLQDIRLVEEKELINKFLKEVSSEKSLVIYGVADVLKFLKNRNVHMVLVSDDINLLVLTKICKKCNDAKEYIVSNENYIQRKQELLLEGCKLCGNSEIEVLEKDLIDYLADKTLEAGAKIEVISSKSEDKVMFNSFGGIGAFVRYR